MSRVNKYRGAHIHVHPQNEHLNGTWIYGYLSDENYINSLDLEGEFLVDKDTVGQYIGVDDKNGKEIYEKDIVRVDGKRELFTVVRVCDTARFGLQGKEELLYLEFGIGSRIEVIGNVYENVDLLEEVEISERRNICNRTNY